MQRHRGQQNHTVRAAQIFGRSTLARPGRASSLERKPGTARHSLLRLVQVGPYLAPVGAQVPDTGDRHPQGFGGAVKGDSWRRGELPGRSSRSNARQSVFESGLRKPDPGCLNDPLAVGAGEDVMFAHRSIVHLLCRQCTRPHARLWNVHDLHNRATLAPLAPLTAQAAQTAPANPPTRSTA